MAKKKYDVRTINFGDKSNVARLIVGEIEKKFGSQKLSRAIRIAIIEFYGKDFEKNILQHELRQNLNKSKKVLVEKARIKQKMDDLGVNSDEVEDFIKYG